MLSSGLPPDQTSNCINMARPNTLAATAQGLRVNEAALDVSLNAFLDASFAASVWRLFLAAANTAGLTRGIFNSVKTERSPQKVFSLSNSSICAGLSAIHCFSACKSCSLGLSSPSSLINQSTASCSTLPRSGKSIIFFIDLTPLG